ncbi:MAG TPA: SDR family oxidoreductase [Gemmatimonadales bacterium]|nr:SDR family oxidoreductase [Gemmatimonadales bacterium]
MTALAGQVAVVSGASRGIGAAAAAALAGEGAFVVRLARSLAPHRGPHGADLRCDLADPDAVAGACTAILEAHGTPGVVVSNAGAFLLRPFEDTSVADLDHQLGVNLRGAFALARGLLPAMRAAGRGTYLHVGSVADHRAFPGNTAYAASKFALRGLHEVLVEEYRGSGVRCTLLSPGPTDTTAWDPVDLDRTPGLTPRARMLGPGDVGEAVRWLATRPPHVHVEWLVLGPAGGERGAGSGEREGS